MKIIYIFFFLLVASSVGAQNFNGQWKGGFNETSYGFSGMGDNGIDYVLELQTQGSKVSGYSYTYFNEGSKRYYTICKLTGSIDRSNQEIIVTEIERTKFNTPPNFQNCFQTHKLHYVQDSADVEMLKGTWIPAPNQTGNCGYGTTLLSRRIVKKLPMGIVSAEKPAKKYVPKNKEVTARRNNVPVKKTPEKKAPVQKPAAPIKNNDVVKDQIVTPPTVEKPAIASGPVAGFKSRRKDIIKTIPISEETFKIDFYDNGEIDGDSISVFYNGRLVLSHQRLSDKPISLKLSVEDLTGDNVVTMYAENLGTIPPNTALMIVTDGDKRYEVRITSDTEKSGSVVFVHQK
ncbi:MAG: hypothetical protein M3015_06250 [Bacteroidota bacterium]|nr:hypothetical protein [Bacteroidota bacterium]